ncbi:hypothetical protein FPZ12_022440 [Amycolatopsis acidicola]|uniref:Uncharacterized protein n=1 Tax=Amycolatopsis acidicola TaxID=2596893 RepID=A0A5N0V055_9PSEU|nr:DUF6346 domain-containing protein [Amycolatopsis acidicola]KAA9158598.1 hypothetical protein FPZ12_022440 [Amycolatopsis acidicola]
MRSDLVRAVAWWAALVLTLLLFATVSRLTHGGGPDVDRLGVATVASCDEYGPVSQYGVGTAYRCTADVEWADGKTEQLVFPAGHLTPGELDVPVYADGGDVGRNDVAWPSVIRLPAVLVTGLLALVAAVGALYTTYRAVRPNSEPKPAPEHTRVAQQRKAAARTQRDWPLTDADRAAAPVPRIVVRFRLLAAWCVLAAVLVSLSAIPRFGAPREIHFVSPWPQIGDAQLIDLPATAAVILGAIAALLLYAMAHSARDDAARIARHGLPYLARNSSAKEMRRGLERRERRYRPNSVVIGLVLLGLTVWAVVRAATVATGPVAVWLACFTDTVLLALLVLIWLATRESPRHRLLRLLGTDLEAQGTKSGTASS